MNGCIVGAGYVGQPLGAVLSSRYNITYVDINSDLVRSLSDHKPTIHEPGLEDLFKKNKERISATTDYSAVRNSDFVMLCVGTPQDMPWDTRYLEESASEIGRNLSKGTLIMVRSTVPVGTNRRLASIIERESGLKAGEGFYMCHCPERMRESKAIQDILNQEKIIGGLNRKSAELGAKIFDDMGIKTRIVSSPEAAEYIKLKTNELLATHIAIQNQMARECDALGLDVHEIREMVGSDPRITCTSTFIPGPGVGGYCLTKDSYILQKTLNEKGLHSKLIDVEREINNSQPLYVADEVKRMVEGGTIGILGLTFKGNTDDLRETPIKRIIESLKEHTLRIHDPHADPEEVRRFFGIEHVGLEDAVNSDLILIGADHDFYRNPEVQNLLRNRRVYDARNILDGDNVKKLGVGR
ncbi:MAG: hypothetical protein DRP11_02235 [Candidatus Aenigmatarchaeota archaeon]|nr:MAG: hypothetical protein DRP11_02235 [Candidatus Aenigmarchaeota archaeon]